MEENTASNPENLDNSTKIESPEVSENPWDNLSNGDNPVIISVQTNLDGYRLKNFYLTNAVQGFAWMMFHFSVVFFFTFLLKSVALVGVFLGFANFVSFCIDIPLGILQRNVSTKKMFIIGAISQLIATGIFFAFIFKFFSLLHFVSWVITPESFKAGNDWFFNSALSWVWVLIASICYGITKEINDVCTYGYVLSHADPSEYGEILSRTNITYGIWALIGLVLAWGVLSLNAGIAVIFLWIVIVGLLVFTIKFFDNSLDSVSLSDIDTFRISIQKWNKENVKEYIVETVQKADIKKVIENTKYLMMKPKQKVTWAKIDWKEVMRSSFKEFKIIWEIFTSQPIYLWLIWTMSLVLIFWFWDTFASSFLLDFLNNIKPGWSYILLAIIGVPGMVLQEYASKLGDKIGMKTIGVIGLFLGWFSLIVMGILALGSTPSPTLILGIALINSVGYACGMSTGQNQFLEIYNRVYAKHLNLKEIDSNASSWPIKVVQNMANVIGLVFGWLLVGFGFPAFFFIFGWIILWVLVWTIVKKNEIQV